jgi:uncharacterized protein YdiU (UPF0061 family)
MQDGVRFGFENTYAQLPDRFFARVKPTPVGAPKLVKVNRALAELLGLDAGELESAEGVEVLAGNRVAQGSEPLAMAYAGHQFGHFVPQLGDGRANLLGEVVGRDGKRYDVQLKGAGRTPYSRGGDGRAALGPVLREYVVSEAMAALEVPTTRALAAVTTGEGVVRDGVLPGAVLTRVAASHLRVGTFQYFAARGDVDGVRVLVEYALKRHYPEVIAGGGPKFRGLLEGVARRQGRLVAAWMLLGFVHGVMNTDNTSISGETIDFGPCAFLEEYDPKTVFSSIDHAGRYGYGNQPHAMHWNLARLAETLLPLLAEEAGGDEAGLAAAYEALAAFGAEYDAARLAGLRRKLGLETAQDGDEALAEDLLERMAANGADFTLTFRRLCGEVGARDLFRDPAAYDAWAVRWRARLAEEGASVESRAEAMRRVNPAYIPRNHRVEAMIEAAVERGNFAPFEELVEVFSRPYDDQPGREMYAEPARAEERVTATFCGT